MTIAECDEYIAMLDEISEQIARERAEMEQEDKGAEQ